MADTVQLTDITQDQYDSAESLVINYIQSAYPKLDMRAGTVIREALVRPDATLNALNIARVENVRSVMSLSIMASTETGTPDQINAELSNFGMTLNAGTPATGTVQVFVNAPNTYTVPAGTIFTTPNGLDFTVSLTTIATLAPVAGLGEVQLYAGQAGSYYFLVPVTASASGSAYNITSGTALAPAATIYGFTTANAYSSFSGGTDSETLANAISRIPAAISQRGLTNSTAITAQLQSMFSGSSYPITALSVQGYGDAAQLRDKHNPFGVAVGGRVDVYTRTFTYPVIQSLTYTGTRIATGTYTFDIPAAASPGFYAIASITDPDSIALASYAFTETRAYDASLATFHDISVDNGTVESAYSIFQKTTVTVTGVPETSTTHTFKVDLYSSPGLSDIQAYVDSAPVRNVGADFVIRCPLMCLVSCSGSIYYPKSAPVSMGTLALNIANHINNLSFGGKLTRSELVGIILSSGASRVDLTSNGLSLTGSLRDAAGNWYTLSGDTIDITRIANPSLLMTPATCVFVTDTSRIVLNGIAE